LRQRSPGVWEAIVSVGRDPLTGKWRYRSRTIRGTKREAQRGLAVFVHDVTTGAVRPAEISVAAALDRWLDFVSDDLSPTTLREYRRLLDRRIRPALGDRQLSRLTTAHLDAFYSALGRQAGLAPATIRQTHSILRRGLRQAVRWGWISVNPAVNTTLPRRQAHEMEPPTPPVIRSLLDAAMEHDVVTGTLLYLAARTGMRRGELCGLKWGDIDLGAARLVVSRSVAALPHGTTEKSTKTHASRRIALDTATVALLERYRVQAEAWAAAASSTMGHDSFVFQSHSRRATTPPRRHRHSRVPPRVPAARYQRLPRPRPSTCPCHVAPRRRGASADRQRAAWPRERDDNAERLCPRARRERRTRGSRHRRDS
jgi:integrase